MKDIKTKRENQFIEDYLKYKPSDMFWHTKMIIKSTWAICKPYFKSDSSMNDFVASSIRQAYQEGYIQGYKKALKKD